MQRTESERIYSKLLIVAAFGEGLGLGGFVQNTAEFKNIDVFVLCVIKK